MVANIGLKTEGFKSPAAFQLERLVPPNALEVAGWLVKARIIRSGRELL